MSIPHRHPLARAVRMLAATAGLVLTAAAVVAGSAPAAADSRTIVVRAGESIQVAVDAARPNTTILVIGGVHAEQLTVSTDGITLIGLRTRLVPPTDVVTNTCSGLAGLVEENGPPTQAGICVTGSGVTLTPFVAEHRELVDVARRVRDVKITGFQVEGFSGPNVAFVGAADARLDANTLVDGAKYGALTVGSTGTRFARNVVRTTELHDIGICADDVTPPTVAHNDVSGYVVGLCVQTQGADFRDNTVHDNCIGVFVDVGIGAFVRNNRIDANNGPCAGFFVNGIGVFLEGTNGTQITKNRITGHSPEGYGAAVVITDFVRPDVRIPATNNTVRNNHFQDNTLDVLVDTTGTGNIVTRNRCTSSIPAGLCD